MKSAFVLAFAATVLLSGSARAESCMKTGEESGGLGKVCYYRCTFGETTVNVGPAQLCPITAQASASRPTGQDRGHLGVACIQRGERISGMSKQCSYECAGSPKVVTVGAAQLCPINPR